MNNAKPGGQHDTFSFNQRNENLVSSSGQNQMDQMSITEIIDEVVEESQFLQGESQDQGLSFEEQYAAMIKNQLGSQLREY